MFTSALKATGKFLAILTLISIFVGCGAGGAKKVPLTLTVSPSVMTYKVTKSVTVSGSGFTPGSIVTFGVAGVGKWKKEAKAAENLWLGFARVEKDRTFASTVSLGRNLWRVKGLSGEYTMIAKNDLGETITTSLKINQAPKKK